MKRVDPSTLRCAIVSVLALGVVFVAPISAYALPTVYFDREDFGRGAGVGMTQSTANSAAAAGIPILQPVGAQPVPSAPQVIQSLDVSTLRVGPPATITSNWTIANNTGTSLENLFLVFLQPEPTIYLDGQSQPISYAPANVGIDLSGGDWAILAVELNSIPVYYPAISLGSLANGANDPFLLHYVLNNPQVFSEFFNFELGMPKWNLAFVTGTPIPEPSTACLVLLGLLAIAGGRHKRS